MTDPVSGDRRGEKVADALASWGIAAVGTMTGAAVTPCRDALLPLAGRRVILWPDADEAGIGHMRAIAAALGMSPRRCPGSRRPTASCRAGTRWMPDLIRRGS
jgi:hypothetical protein